MLTATTAEVRRAIDLLAVQAAKESLTIFDCTGSLERKAQWVWGRAMLHADALSARGLDPAEAGAVADHMVKAAGWCLAAEGIVGIALQGEAMHRAMIIFQITGSREDAQQLAEFAAITAAQQQMEGAELQAFSEALQRAVAVVLASPHRGKPEARQRPPLGHGGPSGRLGGGGVTSL